jgi:hypothetical protein
VNLLTLFYQIGIKGAQEDGLKKMITLIFSKEAKIQDAVT